MLQESSGGFIVRICALASGSSGNSTFVATERTRLLVDAGLSYRDTCNRMASIGEDPARLDAIVITHEHSDHVCGLVRLAKKLADRVVFLYEAKAIFFGTYTEMEKSPAPIIREFLELDELKLEA